MTIQDLGSLGEIIAALATVVTLMYLAVQIRQNSRIVKASTHHSRSRAWSQLEVALGTDSEAARILLKGGRSYEELDPDGRLRYSLLMRAILHQHEDDFVQVQEGLMDASTIARQRRAIVGALAQPAARDWWTENAHLFSRDFQDHVDGALSA